MRTGGAYRLDVHQQVRQAIGTPVGDLNGERLAPPAQGRIVRHSPVQVRQFQQARHRPGRFPERQLQQDLDGPTELNGSIREHRWSARAAVMRRELVFTT